MDVRGKHALVTGAGKRVGLAIAESLQTLGARITGHVHQSAAPASLTSNAGGAVILQADLRHPDAIRSLVQKAESRQGPIDILVCSAAAFSPVDIEACSERDWDDCFALNLKAVFFLAQSCSASLRARRGCIVNLCDIHASKPLERFVPYCASKGGVWTLTRALASELAPEVRVNSVSPGAVLVPESFTREQRERFADRAALGRLGSPQDVAEAVRFLIGNDYITGFDLKVDGGVAF